MLTIQVKGLERATNFIFRKIDKLVSRVSQDTLAKAISVTPVRSGRAKKSWRQIKKGRRSFEVVNNVPYARRLDEGYSKQAPRGITRPASKAIARKYK